MIVTPLDLQVLFSKSVDVEANVARHSAVADIEKTDDEKAMTQQRNEATESIHKLNEYDAEFSKIKEDNHSSDQYENSHQTASSKTETEDKPAVPHRPLLEEGNGNLIDIID